MWHSFVSSEFLLRVNFIIYFPLLKFWIKSIEKKGRLYCSWSWVCIFFLISWCMDDFWIDFYPKLWAFWHNFIKINKNSKNFKKTTLKIFFYNRPETNNTVLSIKKYTPMLLLAAAQTLYRSQFTQYSCLFCFFQTFNTDKTTQNHSCTNKTSKSELKAFNLILYRLSTECALLKTLTLN